MVLFPCFRCYLCVISFRQLQGTSDPSPSQFRSLNSTVRDSKLGVGIRECARGRTGAKQEEKAGSWKQERAEQDARSIQPPSVTAP